MRKVNEELKERLLAGDLEPLLNYIKANDELRMEVRLEGHAIVYYRKGKALETIFNDIRSMVKDKIDLGLLEPMDVSDELKTNNPKLVLVFQPNEESEIVEFKDKYGSDEYEIVVVGKGDYKLSKN